MPISQNIEATLASWWSGIAKDSKQAFLLLLGVSVLAWGTELAEPTFNVDDYGQSLRHSMPHWTQLGRWAADLLYYGALGGWFAPWLHLLLGLTLNVVAMLLVVRLWRPEENLCALGVIVACSMFLCFPYWCDAYSFNTGQVQIPLANLLAVAGYTVARRTLLSIAAGASLIMLGLALYQVSFNFLAVAVVFQVVFRLVHNPSLRQCWASVRSDLLWKLATLPLGVLLYGISLKLVFALLPKRNSRWEAFSHAVNSLGDVALKVKQIALYSAHHLLTRDAFLPAAVKLCVLALVLMGALAAFRRLLRVSPAERTLRESVGMALGLAALLAMAFVAVYATDLATTRSVLGIGYRHTYPVGVIYAGCFLLGADLLRQVVVRNATMLLALYVLTRFVFADNAWSFAQRRLNEFDDALAERILTRVEGHPRFTGFEDFSVAFVGLLPNEAKPADYSSLPGGLIHGSLNCSVFQANHSQRQIFRTKGVDLKEPSKAQREQALRYARGHQPWPHPDAIAIEGDLIIIELGRPGREPRTVEPNRALFKGL